VTDRETHLKYTLGSQSVECDLIKTLFYTDKHTYKNHKITSQEQRKNSRTPHIISRQHHRMNTDHILNVELCTYFFSYMPRSLAH